MKYIAVCWPEIQDYMNNPGYPEKCYFDSDKNTWFIPEDWEPDNLGLGGNIEELLKEVKINTFKSLMEGFKELENT